MTTTSKLPATANSANDVFRLAPALPAPFVILLAATLLGAGYLALQRA